MLTVTYSASDSRRNRGQVAQIVVFAPIGDGFQVFGISTVGDADTGDLALFCHIHSLMFLHNGIIGKGQFVSIVTGSTPLAVEPWGLSNQMTSKALESIGKVGGPRCCKRDSYLAILAAIGFVEEHLNVHMEKSMPVCTRSGQNNQCIGKRCPFIGGKK